MHVKIQFWSPKVSQSNTRRTEKVAETLSFMNLLRSAQRTTGVSGYEAAKQTLVLIKEFGK